MKSMWAYFLLFGVYASGYSQVAADNAEREARADAQNKSLKIRDHRLPGVYRETENKGIIIQSSYPKGDRYVDSKGKEFGVGIFWSRVVNETNTPVELEVNFTGEEWTTPSMSVTLGVSLLSDTMLLDKVSQYSYGIRDLRTVLDAGLQPTRLRRTIKPQEDWFFYVMIIPNSKPNVPTKGGGTRTELILKDSKLFYEVRLDDESLSIPCGDLVFKK